MKIINPSINSSINLDIVTLTHTVAGTFRGIVVNERVSAKVGSDIYIIDITQNEHPSGTGVAIKGRIHKKSGNFAGALTNYTEYFNSITSIFIDADENEIYDKFYIVPFEDEFLNSYMLSKRLYGISTGEFDTANLSSRWDTIMNGTDPTSGFKGKVIGHEKIKDEVISAVLAGKNILLYGPPGTGKTMIANRISRVFDCESKLYTANAEWSSDDTVGGYTLIIDNAGNEKLVPKNGSISDVLVDCNINTIRKFYNNAYSFRGKWAIIDELNRAKMDFAFGALFTALDKDYSVLDLPQYRYSDSTKSEILVPNSFRLVGTINNFDKNFLFKFSYALSRRFSHVYVGIPSKDEFDVEINNILDRIKNELTDKFNIAATALTNLADDAGVKEIRSVISYLRGYEPAQDRIREIGTSQVIDVLKIYCIYKYVLNDPSLVDAQKTLNLVDASVNNVIIPSLEGVLDEEKYSVLKDRIGNLPKCLQSLENFMSINY